MSSRRAPYWLKKARRDQDARLADPWTEKQREEARAIAKDLCRCDHPREDHMPWGCEPSKGTCTCTEFVKKEETTNK